MPSTRLTAHNDATQSENKIHDDDVARRFGFGGGLVPGVTVAAYMMAPVLDEFGPAWLERGSFRARFTSPVYDGGDIEARFALEAGDDDGPDAARCGALTLVDAAGATCASGEASLPAVAAALPAADAIPSAPLPERRPPADDESLAPGTVLGSLRSTFSAADGAAHLALVGVPSPVDAGAGVAHPGLLLRAANRVLVANVVLGPWIHTESSMTLGGLVNDGAALETRARVVELFERKGHQLVTLDVVTLADERPVLAVRHTAIVRLRPPS